MKYTSIAVLLLIDSTSAVRRKHHYEAIQLEREPLLSAPDRADFAFGDEQKKGPGYKMDYFVPNYGMDKEIKGTQKSLYDTEAKLGTWNIKMTPDPEPKRNYFVPDFGPDADVKTTLAHAQAAET